MFNPVSPQGKVISDLFILILVIGGLVFALVVGLTFYAVWSGRRRARNAESGEPEQVSGNLKWEIAWTVGPAVLLAALFVPTLLAMNASDPNKEQNGEPDIIVVGHQWWWEYRYPKANVVTANEMHMPAGKQVLVKLESADVQHDFWVPQLGRKMDMYPDHPNYLYLQSDVPSTYLGGCAEYCGVEHAWMLLRVIVQPQNEFDAWLSHQAQPPVIGGPVAQVAASPVAVTAQTGVGTQEAAAGDPKRGAQVYLNNTCVNCHAISGTTSQAKVGPNLTYLGGRSVLGSGVVENNSANLARWILNAKSIKPGVLMPAYQLNPQDLRDLVAYLEAQK